MRVIGLTGGIGAGKSAVGAAFAALGAAVVDADAIAREVVEPGRPYLSSIVERFGAHVLDGEGRLDRRALAAEVFADPAARGVLEAILHPAIVEASRRCFAELAARGHEVAIYEAALLVETGRYREMDSLVVVTAPDEERVARLMARDGLEEGEVRQRIAAQMSQQEKEALADFVIDNAGVKEALGAKVEAIWQQIRVKVGR